MGTPIGRMAAGRAHQAQPRIGRVPRSVRRLSSWTESLFGSKRQRIGELRAQQAANLSYREPATRRGIGAHQKPVVHTRITRHRDLYPRVAQPSSVALAPVTNRIAFAGHDYRLWQSGQIGGVGGHAVGVVRRTGTTI